MTTIRLPGLIDPHVHLREPGGEHKEDFLSGTKAALAGGITTVLTMPNTQPPMIDPDSLALGEHAAAARAVCDWGIYLGASETNILTAAALAPRVVGMKFYLDATYGPLHIKDLRTIREHFARFPKETSIVCHAEGRTIPAVLMCAYLENRSVHICHVSRAEEITLIRDAKMRGVAVTCEVAPHHLFLSVEDSPHLGGGRCEVRPRLATKADQAALWENMPVIDCFATDHAPHLLTEKDSEIPPPGFPGLETALALMLTAVHEGRLALEAVIERMYDAPRRIFNLPEQPNTYCEVDADQVWSPTFEGTISRAAWTPFAGWTLRGRVVRTVLRGETLYEQGVFHVTAGSGQNVAPAARG
ncbi:MAG TPA: amidohydrolase family protein [Aggregatilineales bacterium]|nr:amidohydrolase family protein [Anaerolineales bacterium]HRE48718.1 amidohydrolase family protein [Aggregatilineales bacterium]